MCVTSRYANRGREIIARLAGHSKGSARIRSAGNAERVNFAGCMVMPHAPSAAPNDPTVRRDGQPFVATGGDHRHALKRC